VSTARCPHGFEDPNDLNDPCVLCPPRRVDGPVQFLPGVEIAARTQRAIQDCARTILSLPEDLDRGIVIGALVAWAFGRDVGQSFATMMERVANLGTKAPPTQAN
jgi:hypothetical protein